MDDEAKSRDLRRDFILREHEALQEKMSRAAADLSRIETIVPLSVAAFYAWLATEGGEVRHLSNWLLWAPVALVLFGAVRHDVRYRYIDVLEAYLVGMEREVYGEGGNPPGWENHWKSQGNRSNRYIRYTMWAALLVATLTVACLGERLLPRQGTPSEAVATAPKIAR
jgi:hypothetical protein